jgi:hypothetical protein
MVDSVFDSMTVQVRAGLGEGRLISAARTLLDRHPALRGSGLATASCVRRVPVAGRTGQALACLTDDEVAAAVGRLGPLKLQAVWLDAGAEESGRLVLVIQPDALAAVPWHVLLPDLVSAWTSSTEVGGMTLRQWVPRPARTWEYLKAV